jgi:hypothetical protein
MYKYLLLFCFLIGCSDNITSISEEDYNEYKYGLITDYKVSNDSVFIYPQFNLYPVSLNKEKIFIKIIENNVEIDSSIITRKNNSFIFPISKSISFTGAFFIFEIKRSIATGNEVCKL